MSFDQLWIIVALGGVIYAIHQVEQALWRIEAHGVIRNNLLRSMLEIKRNEP